jgi:hypothetical protein
MAQRIVRRERIDIGMSQWPRTRTSRVPSPVSNLEYSRLEVVTIATLIEAMLRIAVIRKYHDPMSPLLQPDRSIDDETLSTSNTKIRMEEDDGAFIFGV